MKAHTPTHATFDQISAMKNGATPSAPKADDAAANALSFSEYLDKTHTDALAKMQEQLINQFFKPDVKVKEDGPAKPKLDVKTKADSPKPKQVEKNASKTKPKDDRESEKTDDHDDVDAKAESVDENRSEKPKTHECKNDDSNGAGQQAAQQPKVLTQTKEKSSGTQDEGGDHAATPKQVVKGPAETFSVADASTAEVTEVHQDHHQSKTVDQHDADDLLPKELGPKASKLPLEGLNNQSSNSKQQSSSDFGSKEQNPGFNHPISASGPGLDVKVISVSDNPDLMPALTQPSEKTAESKDAGGKNLTSTVRVQAPAEPAKPIIPTAVILSAMAAAESLGKGDLGIKDALKSYMRESMTNANPLAEVDANPKAQGAAGTGNTSALPQSKAPQQTVPVRMTQLIERVQKAVEAQTPPNPKQITFQVEPHSLGLVSVNMSWTADGWNVNWSVTQNEVREWLAQQVPALQQTNPLGAQIIWNPPTLTPNQWSMAQQQQQGQGNGPERNVDRLLADKDADEGDGKVKPASGDYWA